MLVDKSYRRNLHNVVTDLIPKDVIEEGNKDKSWKYGRQSEYDLIVISKNGTIGKILNVQGLNIAIPKEPENIQNKKNRAENQKWERYNVPKELLYFDKYYKAEEVDVAEQLIITYNKHRKFIEEDFERIYNGDWFYNDGEPIYITGYFYFFLQHYKLTDISRYPDFRMPQNDYFYWLEACFADDTCAGSLLLKSRRSAFTVGASSIVICNAIGTHDGFYPIVSKNKETAQDLFSKHIVKPFNNLPKHLQPQRTGDPTPKAELNLSAPKKKITVNNKGNDTEEGLNTFIAHYATTIDAYDSTQVTMSINDEIGKFKGNLDVNEYWDNSHKLCHITGSEVEGKAICGSTANPPNLGGRNYERFYNESKLETKDESGFTITALYSIFVPADYTTYGYFDEWGYVIYDDPNIPIKNEIGKIREIGVKRYLDNKEVRCGNNLKKLNTQKRKEPRVDTDAFLDEDATMMFATEGLVTNSNFIKKTQYEDKYKTQVHRFNLYWKDGIQDGEVEKKNSANGRFECSWLPPLELRNKFKEVNGKRYPINTEFGAFGCDPYQASRVSFGNGSMQGLIGLTTNNPFKLAEAERRKMFIYYNARPNTIEEAIEDVIMIIHYCSMPVLIEINKEGVAKELVKRGYRKYIMNNPLKNKNDLSGQELTFGGIYSHPTNIPTQENKLQSFINENLSVEIDEDNLKVPFLGALADAEIYETKDRQKRDQTVAWMYAVIATEDNKNKKKEISQEVETTNIYELFLN